MNINEVTQVSNTDSSANFTEKRKRGRPRKYPKLSAEDNIHIPKIQRMNREDKAKGGGPPGFGGTNGNQPRPVAATYDAANSMVGRSVSGVIEAVFDAGYLLNVRVANSDTTLRGVVFRPGRFVPVSADNDVAPSVEMIKRSEIPIQPSERKDLFGANNSLSKCKLVPSVGVQTARSDPVIARGNLVPVVLEPKSSNGLPLVTEPTPFATDSKGKQPQDEATRPTNGLISTTQVSTCGSEAVLSQPQTTHQLVPEAAQNDNGRCNQPSVEATDAKSTRLHTMPFENLVTEVIKRIKSPSQSLEGQAVDDKLEDKMSMEDEDESDDEQALDIEPLQAVLLNNDNNIALSAPKPVEDARTSKMTQLLEGTVTESPMTQPVAAKFSQTPSLATE